MISYSILNNSNQPVEILPPQVQMTGRKAPQKKKQQGSGIISDQLEIRDYKLSTTRLEPGERADGVSRHELACLVAEANGRSCDRLQTALAQINSPSPENRPYHPNHVTFFRGSFFHVLMSDTHGFVYISRSVNVSCSVSVFGSVIL